jgi:DNA-binding transcriptional MocR family regulator
MRLAGYRTIAGIIRERIASGAYNPGAKIPSIREFAAEFQCNKLTVHRAFELLKQEGLIENRVGSGSYVRFPEQIMGSTTIFDFRSDYLDPSLFPYDKIQSIFNQLFDDKKALALAPSPVEGDPGLIQALSRYYYLPADQMMIISGAQQGLDLVAKVFGTKISEALLFEDPTYPGAISLFKARHFVPLKKDGPDLKHLKDKLQASYRLFYTMPTVHNPTGMAYSLKKKKAISRLARAYDFYIIEDDCFSEFKNSPIPRFIDLCSDHTIYIKSLSQITVSGIRLGLMVVPEKLYASFLQAKFSSDIASFGLMQRCMCEFIQQGFLQQHIDTVCSKLNQRRKRLQKVIEDMHHLTWTPKQAGYSLWIKSNLPMPVDPVPWSRGEEFSFTPQARSYFRLAFMHMDDDLFERGLEYLKQFLSHPHP